MCNWVRLQAFDRNLFITFSKNFFTPNIKIKKMKNELVNEGDIVPNSVFKLILSCITALATAHKRLLPVLVIGNNTLVENFHIYFKLHPLKH